MSTLIGANFFKEFLPEILICVTILVALIAFVLRAVIVYLRKTKTDRAFEQMLSDTHDPSLGDIPPLYPIMQEERPAEKNDD